MEFQTCSVPANGREEHCKPVNMDKSKAGLEYFEFALQMFYGEGNALDTTVKPHGNKQHALLSSTEENSAGFL